MISNEKDHDTTQPSVTSPVSETPFSDGLDKELSANDKRKERLKLAIKNHALKSRQTVKARRAPK